jgi:hypothetical protein
MLMLKILISASIFFFTFNVVAQENDNSGPQSCGEFVSDIMGSGYVGDKSEPTGNGGIRCYYKSVGDKDPAVSYGVIWPKEPYNPQTTREDLEATYGEENVISTSVVNNPNQRVNSNEEKGVEVINDCPANKAVSVDYEDPLTGAAKTANIPYNERGLPVFDDVTKFTTRIDKSKNYSSQMGQATIDLKNVINDGTFASTNFTAQQLADIQAGKEAIAGYTWHHNADNGSMQLVPRKVHDQVKHIGQGAMCKGK